MRSKSFIMAAVLMMVFFSSVSFAATIYLRDGRILKEKIIRMEKHYIITEERRTGIPKKYYMGQIDRIEEDKADMENIDVKQFEEMGMSVDKAELIVVLIDASGVRANMEKNLARVINGLPDEEQGTYREIFNVEEIIEQLVPLYDKYYTEDEIWKIIEFYESPAGKKTLEVTPKIMKESIGVSLEYFKQKTTPQ